MQKNIAGKKLKIFMRGKSVGALQTQLQQRGFSITDSPGVFGPSTRDAVKSFQSQMALSATGVVDESFWQAFGHHRVAPEEKNGKLNALQNHHQVLDSANPKLDALIHLLVEKGIIEQNELDLLIAVRLRILHQ